MRQEKSQKSRPATVLVLCFCAVALVSVMVVKANIDKVRDNMENANVAEVVQEKAADENDSPDVVDSLDNHDSKSEDENDTNTVPQFIMPVDGEIIMEHSMDQLVYWKTLDQYMTHCGIDIEAPAGTSVKACSAGTVTRIEEDDRFGIIAEVTHGNGLVSLYGNLAADDLAEIGDVVECGDTIGKIGTSSMFEFESPDHVHFEMSLNGEPVDPEDYI